MEHQQKCKNLLASMEDVYRKYLEDDKIYHQNLRKYQDFLETKLRGEDELDTKKKKFNESQYIFVNNNTTTSSDSDVSNVSVVNCQNCKSSEQLEKCRCQQMFGRRPHLLAGSSNSINNNNNIGANNVGANSPLTKEICEAKGYLSLLTPPLLLSSSSNDEDSLYHSLCAKHLELNDLNYSCNCPPINKGESSSQGENYSQPKPPILHFPSITCGPCRKEFERLQDDFSHENISQVNRCISLQDRQENIDGQEKLIQETPRPFLIDEEKLTKENDKEKKKEKLFNVLLILVSLFLFIGSLYLIYCISRNLPYDLVCAKIDIVKNAEKNSEEKSESSEKNNEATTNDQDVEDEEYDDQENLEDNKASADD
jgi:hypothetical protein